MFGRLFLLFTLGPLIELALLLYFADTFGWRATLVTVVATGLLGAWLVRREGWRAWERIQRDLNEGRMPTNSMIDGLMIFAGGVLLITPGVLSDLLGLALVFPPTRALIRRYVRRRFEVRATTYFHASSPPLQPRESGHDRIIDVRLVEGRKDRERD